MAKKVQRKGEASPPFSAIYDTDAEALDTPNLRFRLGSHTALELATGLLEVAVPLWAMQLEQARARDGDDGFNALFRQWTDEEWAEQEGVFSEALIYRDREEGKSARAFNALAKMIAAMSYVPGGVPFGNVRWVRGRAEIEYKPE